MQKLTVLFRFFCKLQKNDQAGGESYLLKGFPLLILIFFMMFQACGPEVNQALLMEAGHVVNSTDSVAQKILRVSDSIYGMRMALQKLPDAVKQQLPDYSEGKMVFFDRFLNKMTGYAGFTNHIKMGLDSMQTLYKAGKVSEQDFNNGIVSFKSELADQAEFLHVVRQSEQLLYLKTVYNAAYTIDPTIKMPLSPN